MVRMMNALTAASLAIAAAGGWLYRVCGYGVFLTLSITFGTMFYHLGVRLMVGAVFQRAMGNRADYSKKWYRLRPWENGLYRRLGVKNWKEKMPTYYPAQFSPKLHTWDEIAQAMCQSELVHETNMVLSFPPVIAYRWFGALPVFLLTSVLAAAFDLMFVMMQRYNRPRVIKIALKQRQNSRCSRGNATKK